MKVAIIHYWLVGMRGGEKVIESLCEMYPDADIFTHAYAPHAISDLIKAHDIKTSFISRLPRPTKNYKSYLPLMPLALEQLDLRGYDLIISSESGPSKGIIPPAGALHVCYCHSPMRYLWNMFHEYRDSSGRLKRWMIPVLSHYLRNWDALSATRVHQFAANSRNVAKRVESYYRREATIVYPPVDVEAFSPIPAGEVDDYFLMVGELVAYKRPELAVQAFNLSKRRLVIIGGGERLAAVKAMAGPTVEVLGPQPFSVLRHHYARCRALVFPGEEDFGIVPVEAMASGRPVVAFRRGGATESVVDGETGVFFDEQSVEALLDGLAACERTAFDSTRIAAHARKFGRDRFTSSMQNFIDASWASFHA